MREPRENDLTCKGCGEYLTMDEIQAGGHTCRVSSNDLSPLILAYAQAGRIGTKWEVTPDGLGFVWFNDPLEARDILRASNAYWAAVRPPSEGDHADR